MTGRWDKSIVDFEQGEGRGPASRVVRPRLHLVYFLLAAFDVITVCVSLYLIDSLVVSYEQSVATNQRWAARLNDYSRLSALAAAVNAPGNDVFESRAVEAESERLRSALAEFEREAARARADLTAAVAREAAQTLLPAFDRVPAAMRDMVAEAERIFAHLKQSRANEAGARMAFMDRAYARVNLALAELANHVRAIQKRELDAQTSAAAALRRFEYVVGGLIVVMVSAVTIYGYHLTQRMKQAARDAQLREQALARNRDELERRVDERTAALRATHEQLRLSERLASIGALAAGLGHDMNNILFPTRCRLDTLEAGALPDAAREPLAELRKSVDYLQSLSDGLRLLALDPNNPALSRATTDLRTWWTEAAPLMRSALPRRVGLRAELPEGLPPLAVPAHGLTQAVFNLVGNAGEAIEGAGAVAIGAELTPDGGFVRVRVADDGAGMPPEIRRRALEPFYTTKPRGMSTGLGLALAHGVATSAGGALDIESEPGRGTTVTLTLPVAAGGTDDADKSVEAGAVVTVQDRRLATLVAGVLRSVGATVRRLPQPGDARLWVTEAGPGRFELARGWQQADARRAVVLLGAAPPEWDALRARRVALPVEIECLRTAVLASLNGAPESDA